MGKEGTRLLEAMYHRVNGAFDPMPFNAITRMLPLKKTKLVPDKAKDYRPILLLTAIRKAFEASDVHTLRNLFSLFYSGRQKGGIPGGGITEPLAWAMEKTSGGEGVLVYLDISKAYDTVRHAPFVILVRFLGHLIDKALAKCRVDICSGF